MNFNTSKRLLKHYLGQVLPYPIEGDTEVELDEIFDLMEEEIEHYIETELKKFATQYNLDPEKVKK
jgi:hypothetical protein